MSLRSITRLLPALWLLAGLAVSALGEQPAEPAQRLAELVARGEALLELNGLVDEQVEEAKTVTKELSESRRAEPAPGTLGPGDLASLQADLLLITVEPQAALTAYLEAEKLGGISRHRRGALYQGKLYIPEIYAASATGVKETTYLLGLDPQTGVVRERHLLPGRVRGLRVEAGALRVDYVFDYNDRVLPGSLRVIDGELDRPIGGTYGSNFMPRLHSMRAGWQLVGNFVYRDQSTYSPVFKCCPDDEIRQGPVTLDGLETELRSAMRHDPTQPWHLFFLGQTLWAQNKLDDAVVIWEQLFTSPFPATPYYEYAWMSSLFETYHQQDWADRAYRKAHRSWRDLHQPLAAATLVERLVNLPFGRQRIGSETIDRMDHERSHVWWSRTRAMSGISELDPFFARAWAEHYEATGELERAQSEWQYFRETQKYPYLSSFQIAWFDYFFWLAMAAGCGLGAALGGLWQRRPRERALPERGRARTVLLATLTCYLSLNALGVCITYFDRTARLGLRPADNPIIETLQSAELGITAVASPAAPLAEAVARHLAGDLEAARELYRAVPNDPRAAENLRALEQGRLPPNRISYEEAFEVRLSDVVLSWLREVAWNPRRWLELLDVSLHDFSPDLVVICLVPVVIGFFAVIFFPLRPGPQGGLLRPFRQLRLRAGQVVATVIPGVCDLIAGSATRGWAVFSLFAFGTLPLAWLGLSSEPVTVGFGSALTLPNFTDLTPTLPIPPELSRAELVEHFRWTIFWSHPYAHTFWSLVAAALVGAIVGELPTGAVEGLGARMLVASQFGQPLLMWASLFMAAIVAGVLILAVGLIQKLADARMGQAMTALWASVLFWLAAWGVNVLLARRGTPQIARIAV
ncbi:MAG: hypothetical protein HC897_19195, partial [Thermoanaerobaculia bacterium]|nr:hypothetical protein [Thermoanaerobaculia bacterium]